jgi:hypothetical protein
MGRRKQAQTGDLLKNIDRVFLTSSQDFPVEHRGKIGRGIPGTHCDTRRGIRWILSDRIPRFCFAISNQDQRQLSY